MFQINGKSYSAAEMLAANADDEDVSEWLLTAKPGDVYEAMHAETVRCIA